jgi:hypothetical protein
VASRSLLHKNDLEAFLEFCRRQGHETRDGKDFWQVAQIKLKGKPQWHALYQRAHMPEHLTVTEPLMRAAIAFYKEKRAGSQQT